MIGRIKGKYNTWLIIDITNLILCFLHLRVFELKQIINDDKENEYQNLARVHDKSWQRRSKISITQPTFT